MVAWINEIYLLVFKIDTSTLEDKFHISAQPCIILLLTSSLEQELIL